MDGYSDSLFIITNNCGQYMNNIPNVNIIVLFADDIYYSYKKIVYMCGSINSISEIQSELILVSKEISEDIDNAKNITREFNKVLWEKQYLDISKDRLKVAIQLIIVISYMVKSCIICRKYIMKF